MLTKCVLPSVNKICYYHYIIITGFNDHIYHEGDISKMTDFDAFSCFGMPET